MSLPQASLAVATAREAVDAANERRHRPRGWVAATDRCLWELEGLNLAEVAVVPARRLVAMRRLLATLPSHCRPELPDGVLTQVALDAVFDAQERLFGMRPVRTTEAVADTFDAEEMDRWEALCLWLDEAGGVACATPRTAKAPRFFTEADDGLRLRWAPARTFCNPPYSSVEGWVRKARAEAADGALVVCLLAARTDRDWFHDLVMPFAEVRFIRGRQRFIGKDGTTVGRPFFASMLAIYRPPSAEEGGE